VNVGNFPLDEHGNLRVSGGGGTPAPPVAHFVGVTTATVDRQAGFDPEYPILAMNRACQAEFPETRSCLYSDILKAIPTPDWNGCVLLATGFEGPNPVGLCVDSRGNNDFSGVPQHAACCGF